MKNLKMSTKLSAVYAVMILLVVSTGVFGFYRYSEQEIFQEGVENLSQMADSAMGQADGRLNNMNQAMIEVLTNGEFLEEWERFCREKEEESAEKLRRILTYAYKDRTDIRRISVYDPKGNYVTTGKHEVSTGLVQKHADQLLSDYDFAALKGSVFLGPRLDFWEPSTEVSVISEVTPVRNKENRIVGYLEVQQNQFYMKNICDIKWGKKQLVSAVFWGSEGKILFSNVAGNDVKKYAELTEQYVDYQETKTEIIATAWSNYYTCRMVTVLPKNILFQQLNKNMQVLAAAAGVLIILTGGYLFWATRLIMRPINLFVKKMAQTDLSNIAEPDRETTMNWETQILSDAFGDMKNRLQMAIAKEKQMTDVQTKTLFSILQSEISPHFLYNTLGSIANMCEAGNTEEAADACYSLTEIMRYSSNFSVSEVTLHEEVENLKSYFAIMKSRYRQRFEYELQSDEEVLDFMVPKLTLQPIVENAIKYSLLEKETVIVKVLMVCFDGHIIIEVKDNGVGISEADARKVQRRIEEFQSGDHAKEITDNIQIGGMGLSGTLIRLSIYFGEAFSYELLRNNDEGGTTIVLKIGEGA